MDLAPTIVTAPDGSTYQPVRAYITDDDRLAIDRKDGSSVALLDVLQVTGSKRITRVETPEGTWTIRTGCSCQASWRALLREWAS